MPFTPFHLGPALGIGLPLRRHLHLPTLLIASIIVDVEPFLVLVLGLSYPLHGYLHTFVFAGLLGLILGYVMKLLDGLFSNLWRKILLVAESKYEAKHFLIAGALGTLLHVLYDSPLYSDIRPFYPLSTNPFYDSGRIGLMMTLTYGTCTILGLLGFSYYMYLFVKKKS